MCGRYVRKTGAQEIALAFSAVDSGQNLALNYNISPTSEVFPALNTLTKGSGNNEIRNSNITDNGSVVAINSNSQITGSLGITGNINMVNGTDLVTHHVKAPAVNGVEIQNNSGGVVGLFGAGGSLGSTFYGQVNATAFSGSGALVTGVISSSYAANAQQATSASFASTASFFGGSVVSASYAATASIAYLAEFAVIATSATSASYATLAQNAVTANSATTATSASYSNNSTSASYALNATSASIAQTASFYEGSVVSASYAANSTSASYALNATSASFAPSTPAFPFSGSAQITGSLGVTGSIRQIIGVGSGTITAITNSFVGNTVITGSGNGNSAFRVSGSVTILKNLQIGSAASTANNTVTLSSLTSSIMAVDATGDSTTTKAQLRITSADSSVGDTGSAVIITSAFTGSTFGDYDTTAFVNRTFLYIGAYSSSANPSIPVFTRGLRVSGSLGVTGSLSISGSVNATSITSSLLGTASYADNALSASYSLVATSASYAANSTSASYANTATSASYALNATSASVAVTASFALTTAGGIQGSEIYSYTFLLMGA